MKTLKRATLLALLLGLNGQAIGMAADASWNLPALMAALADRGPQANAFTEERHISVLDHTLVFKGELRYHSPQSIEKITSSPALERMTIEGDQLTIKRGQSEPRQIMLSEYPPLEGLIASIRDTLAGDQAALEQRYQLRLQGAETAWRLTLRPRDRHLSNYIVEILIHGKGGQISVFEVWEANGDSSKLQLEE